MSGPDRCRSCFASIVWRKTAAGKSMPIDLEPTVDGNLVLEDDGRVRMAKPNDAEVGACLYRSHFSTCPNSAEHRRPR